MCNLRDNSAGGGSALVRFAAGADFPLHDHPGWEEAFLLDGEVEVGDETVRAGDYLCTHRGERHAVRAVKASMIFVNSEKSIEVVESD